MPQRVNEETMPYFLAIQVTRFPWTIFIVVPLLFVDLSLLYDALSWSTEDGHAATLAASQPKKPHHKLQSDMRARRDLTIKLMPDVFKNALVCISQ